MGCLLRELLAREDFMKRILSHLAELSLDEQNLKSCAEFHLNKYEAEVEFGPEVIRNQYVSPETSLFVSWMLACLRTEFAPIEFSSAVNLSIKEIWRQDLGDLSGAINRDIELVLSAWSVGQPIWKNGNHHPATFLVGQLGRDIELAYSGLVEHLRTYEKEFSEDTTTEIMRTSVIWRMTGLFEALANTSDGPENAMTYIAKHSHKVFPEQLNNLISARVWPGKVVVVRNAFTHIAGTLGNNYEVPTSAWVTELVNWGNYMAASALSYYFANDVPRNAVQSWWDRIESEITNGW